MWPLILCILLAYLLGSVPFALLLGFLKGVDIRKVGSGNIGATNLTRTLGRRWGIAAFLLDFLKGLLPAFGMRFVATRFEIPIPMPPPYAQGLCGLAAVFGHIFPVFLGFRGGKGVATSFGVLAGLMPVPTLFCGLTWLAVFKATRFVSLASIIAAIGFPIAFPISARLLEPGMESRVFYSLEGVALAAAALILWRHHENIRRLFTGKENRF
jgi:glycerol-3-phosphate acyltransferase PlsY